MADEKETADLIELRKQYDDMYSGMNTFLGLGKNNPSAGDDKPKAVKPVRATATPVQARDFELEDVKSDTEDTGFTCGKCGETLDGEVAFCPHCGIGLSWESEDE